LPFALDILACPDCGGRLRLVVATIEQRAVIEKILTHLTHLGLPVDLPSPATDLRRAFGRQAARSPEWFPGWVRPERPESNGARGSCSWI
jgi:uncharacterized protein YbaR (Trm112 family)